MNNITAKLNNNTSKGFTLIELMIVIAIIAILAVVGATVYGNIQSRGRDSARVSDIESIATALEAARSNANTTTYPALAVTMLAAGAIPVDPSGDPDSYCVAHSQTVNNPAAAIPATGANWPATQACPTAPAAGGGNSAYVAVTAGPPAVPPAATTAFRICARLENGAGIYCKGNQQ